MAKAKGDPKTGGRQKGTPNKLTKELKGAILEAAENVGRVDVSTEYPENGRPVTRRLATGAGGLVGYLQGLALDEPVAFAGLLGKTLPKDVTVDTTLTIIDDRAETEALIRNLTSVEPPVARPADGKRRIAPVVH